MGFKSAFKGLIMMMIMIIIIVIIITTTTTTRTIEFDLSSLYATI